MSTALVHIFMVQMQALTKLQPPVGEETEVAAITGKTMLLMVVMTTILFLIITMTTQVAILRELLFYRQ